MRHYRSTKAKKDYSAATKRMMMAQTIISDRHFQ